MEGALPIQDEEIDIEQPFKDKAAALSLSLKAEVTYEFFRERDKNKELVENGKIFVAYVRKPHAIVAARAMDCILAGKIFEAGGLLWQSCFLKTESSPEIESIDRYKVGLQGKLGSILDVQAPEVKKN